MQVRGRKSTPAEASDGKTTRLLIDAPEGEEDEGEPDLEDDSSSDQTTAYSAREVLRQRDFSQLEAEEIAEVRRLIALLRWQPAMAKASADQGGNERPSCRSKTGL